MKLRVPRRRLAPLAGIAAALLAACASPEMAASYEQSLMQWQGAPADRLVAAWGRPKLEETLPGGARALTYVVRHDLQNADRMSTTATVSAGRRSGVVTTAGMPTSAVVPITCTTRFVLQDGVVSSWTFKGVGCGAPDQ